LGRLIAASYLGVVRLAWNARIPSTDRAAIALTCPQQFNQFLSYDGVQVKPEMVCQRESENLGFESF
jgi:hypothetical protein